MAILSGSYWMKSWTLRFILSSPTSRLIGSAESWSPAPLCLLPRSRWRHRMQQELSWADVRSSSPSLPLPDILDSPSVSKASAGAMELYQVYSVRSVRSFCCSCRLLLTCCSQQPDAVFELVQGAGLAGGEGGERLWSLKSLQVIGSALGENSVPVSSTKLTKPTLLVMGNEGRGLRTNVLRECDVLVQIEAASASVAPDDLDGEHPLNCYLRESDLKDLGDDVLDSLNVSVAGGILIHHFLCAK